MILDNILNNQEPIKPKETKAPSTLLESALNISNSGHAKDIQLGQFGVGESKLDTEITPENVSQLEDIRGNKQETLDRLGNSAGRFVTHLTSYLGQTAGQLLGVPAAIATQDISKITSNPIVEAFDGLKDWGDKQMPLYETQAYKDAGILDKVFGAGRSQWWETEGLDRAALAASMLVPGAIEAEGLGVARLAGEGLESSKLSSAFDGVSDAFKMKKNWTASALDKSIIGVPVQAQRIANQLKGTTQILGGTITQSALSGYETEKAVKNQLTSNREQGLNQFSDDEINKKAFDANQKTFWETIPSSLLTSMVTLPQLFSSFNGVKHSISDVIDEVTGLNKVSIPLTTGQKVVRTIGKGLLTGIEGGPINENLQVAISKANEDYAEGKTTSANFQDILNDWVSNFSDPTNGQNNIALGFIQGLLESGLAGHNSIIKIAKGKDEYTSDYKSKLDLQNYINKSVLNYQKNDGKTFNVKNEDGSDKIDPSTGLPIIDKNEVVKTILGNIGSIVNSDGKKISSLSDDKLLFNLSDHNALTALSYSLLGINGGFEHINNLLELGAKKAKEVTTDNTLDYDQSGSPITPDRILTEKKEVVNKLRKSFNEVKNTKINLSNITPENRNDAYNFIENIRHTMFDAKSAQLFISKQIQDNNLEKNSIENSLNKDLNKNRLEEIEKENKGLEELSKYHLDKVKELSKTKVLDELFSNYKENNPNTISLETTPTKEDKIIPIDEFKTMDLGTFEGQPETKEYKEHQADLFENHPDEKIGGGESPIEFIDRVLTKFQDLLHNAKDNTVITTHSSVLKAFKVWDEMSRPDLTTLSDTQVKKFGKKYNNTETETGDVKKFKSDNGTLIVARHGETEDNLAGNLRSPNTKLTEKGINQAKEVGKQLKDVNIPQIISSSLPRALHTSQLILDEQKSKKDEKSESTDSNIDESDVNGTNTIDNITSIEVKKNGAIAQTPFKTESGIDDDSDPNRTRLFRWIEKNKLADKRLLIVTKNNNSKLYNEILNLRPEAVEFESKNKNYQGIYTVIVDDKNNIIRISDNINIQNKFKEAGEKAKQENKSEYITNFLLENAKIGDTITDKNGDGYEITEINIRKDGTKEIIIVPFEIIDGKKDYNYSGSRIINKKNTGDLYENTYTNSKGERITEIYNYNTKEEDKPLFTTLSTKERLEDGNIKASKEEIDQLTKLRQDILNNKNPNIYLPITGKSKGIIEYLPKIEGKRQSNSVINRIVDNIKNADLTLLTTPAFNNKERGLLPNGLLAKIGKLYIKDSNGNYIDLVPRKLNDNEINIAFTLINQLMKVTPQLVVSPKTELEKIMFTGVSKRGQNEFTIAVKNGALLIGTEILTKEQFDTEEGRNKLAEALSNKYVNISRDNDLNSEFYGPKIDDKQDSKKYNSYKEYLLEGEHPMFGTDIQTKSEVQYRNQYITYTPSIKTDEIKGLKEGETPIYLNTDGDVIDESTIEETTSKHNLNTTSKQNNSPLKGFTFNNIDESLDRLANKSRKLISKEEENWFKVNFPNIPIERIQGLIDGKSFGRFLSEAKVLLSDIATEGTLYHEAFHVITQLYLTKDEINKLYKEASIKYPNKTRKQLEEILAEDFSDYKQTGKILGDRIQRNTIFRRLWNAIKDLLGIKANTIQDVYRRLDKGFYTTKSIVGTREFTQLDKQIPGLSVSETKQLLDGVDAEFYEILLDKNNKTIGDLYSKPELVNKILDIIKKKMSSNEFVDNNWNEIVKSWADRFKSLSGDIELGDLSVNDNGIIKDETADSRQGDALAEFNSISTKSLVNKETRLLIRGLLQKEYNSKGELVNKLNDLGLKQPVEFNKTYNLILDNLQGLSNWNDQYNKLKELSEKHPSLIGLINRLGQPSGELSMDKFMQWMKFRQDFDKNKLNSFITVIETDGNIYLVNAVSQVVYDRIKEEWRNNLKSIITVNKDGKLILPIDLINEKDNIKFLNSIGIKLSSEAIEATKDNNDFIQSVNQLREFIKNNNGDVTELYTDKGGLSGRLNTLYQLEGDISKSVNELSYISSENKTVYSITQNNFLSKVKNIINNSENLQQLYLDLPHLNNVSTEGSVWMNKLFNKDGSRNKEITLDLDLHDGMKNKDQQNPKSSTTAGLSIGEKYVQEINTILLTGKSSFIRASDKASEFIPGLNQSTSKSKLIIPIDKLANSFNIQEVREIFSNYFKSEMNRIALFELKGVGSDIDQYNSKSSNKPDAVRNGGKFTIFSEFPINKKIIQDEIKTIDKTLSNEEISKEIDNIFNKHKEDINNSVQEYLKQYIKEIENKLKEYEINLKQGLSQEFKDNSIEQLTRAIAVNDLINSIEQVKLFIGDMAFYKDLFKRTAAYTGTKETSATGDEINSFLNNNNKRIDGKQANNKINILITADSKQKATFIIEYTKSLVDNGLTPNQAKEVLQSYYGDKDKGMDEADAQGGITLDEYREFFIRLGKWDLVYENAFDKLQKKEYLKPNELVTFLTLKAQYAGPQDYNNLFAPAYHKFSLLPLIPQLVNGTNLERLLNEMTNKQVGYFLFKSGSKVGTRLNTDGKVTPFYKSNGELNTDNWTNQVIDYKFFGLQVKSSEPKAKVIFGTQFRKLLFLDLFENGKSGFETQYNEYNDLISSLVNDEKAKLIKELGINSNKNYKIDNVKKLVDLLQDEAKRRSLADNIVEALQYEIIEGNTILKYNLDTMVNKDKIDSMIMSLVDSRLIRQKMNGDAMVQGSVAGFEKSGIRTDNTLKFYHKNIEGNTESAECHISMSKEFHPLLVKYNNNLDELNEAISSNTLSIEDKALLEMVGYRIPTQGLNSMEALKIIKFLPESSNTIILPTELVAKSGGDFDIDKLNIFRKNNLSKIGEKYDKLKKATIDKEFINDEATTKLIKQLFGEDFSELTQDDINDILTNANLAKTKEEYLDKYIKQNKIVDLAREILLHKDNFINLITPNTTKELKGLANQFEYEDYLNRKRVEGKTPVTLEDYITNQEGESKNIKYTSQLKLTTKIDQFYKFMLAKEMIGIAAIANTHHSLCQQVNATLNSSFINKEEESEQVNINLPYNKLDDNKISLGSIKDVKGKNKISDIISQIINATVDAAKDPFMFTINMTKDTLGTYLYLIRIGVPFNIVGNFMKQPIITDYLKRLSVNKSSYNKESITNKELINKTKFKFKEELTKSLKIYNKKIDEYIKDNSIKFNDEKQLSQFLNNDNKKGDLYNQTQLQVLDDFLRYKDQSQLLSDAMRATNIDTAGIGQNLGSVQSKQDLINKVVDSNFFNGLADIFDKTFIGAMNVNILVDKMYSPLYYTHSSPEIKANTNKLVDNIKQTLFPFTSETETKLRKLIENDFINYIIQNYGYKDIKTLQNKLFYLDSVAKRLIKAKENPYKDIADKDLTKEQLNKKKLANNILIQELYPLIGQVNKNVDNIKIFAKRYDTYTADLLTESFRELGELDDPNAKQLYKDLMDLGIIQSGLNNSPITYLGLIPYEYYNELAKKAFENFNKLDNKKESINQFNKLFIENNTKSPLIWKYAKEHNLLDKAKGYGEFGKIYDNNNVQFKKKILSTLESQIDDSNLFSKKNGEYYLKQNAPYGNAIKFINRLKANTINAELYKIPFKTGQLGRQIWALKIDNQLNLQFAKGELIENNSKESVIQFTNDLTNRLGKEVKFITNNEAKEILGDQYRDSKGFFYKGISYIVDANLSTVLHEMSHPFVDSLANNNPKLFNNILEQVIKENPEIYKEVENNYKEDFIEINRELVPSEKAYKEMAVRAITKLGIQNIDTSTGSPKTGLEKLWQAIKNIINKLFGNKLDLKDLSPNTTLKELADLITTFEGKINLKDSNGSEQFLKKEKSNIDDESAYKKQQIFFTRRLKALEKQQERFKENTPRWNELQNEIDKIQDSLTNIEEVGEHKTLKILGEETLNRVEGYIRDLEESDKTDDSNKNIKYLLEVLNTFEDFKGLADKTLELRERLYPFVQSLYLKTINENKTEDFTITQEMIDKQNEDISKFKEGTASLRNLSNYIARTIGIIIGNAQNEVSTKRKHLKDEIQTKLDKLTSWGKKNEIKLEDIWKLFSEEKNGTLVLVSPPFEHENKPNYTKIQNTPELKSFYDFYQKKIVEYQKGFPYKPGEYFIPNLHKTSISSFFKNLVPVKEIKQGDFIGTEGLYADILSTKYLNNIKVENKSNNLADALLEFGHHSNSYNILSEVLPEVRVLQEGLKYKINEKGDFDDRKFIKSSNQGERILGENSNLNSMINKWVDIQLKGKSKLAEGEIKVGNTYDEKGNINGSKYIYTSDIIDTGLKWNSMIKIGFAPISILSNISFGQITNFIEATGGQFYSLNHLHLANKIFWNQTFKKDSEMNKLLEELNLLREMDDYERAKNPELKGQLSPEKLQELMYSGQKAGEKWNQATPALAIMLKQGYITRDGVLTDKWNNSTEKEKSDLVNKTQRLNSMNHGRYSAQEAATASQHIWYRAVTQFRKWVIAMFESRFNKEQYDVDLGTTIEGRYRTFNRLIFSKSVLNNISKLAKGELNPTEMYNMKKNLTEVILFAATIIMGHLLLSGSDDDKKKLKKNHLAKLTLTLLDRAAGDLDFFYSPNQIVNLGSNAVPLAKFAGDLLKTIKYIPAIFDYEIGLFPPKFKHDKKAVHFRSGVNKGKNKELVQLLKIIPGLNALLQAENIVNKNMITLQ